MCPISTILEPSSPQPSQPLSPNMLSRDTQTQSVTPQPRRTPWGRQSTNVQCPPLPPQQSQTNQRNAHPNPTRTPPQSTIWNFVQRQMPQTPENTTTTQNDETISVHNGSINKTIQIDLTPLAQLNQNNTHQSELDSSMFNSPYVQNQQMGDGATYITSTTPRTTFVLFPKM